MSACPGCGAYEGMEHRGGCEQFRRPAIHVSTLGVTITRGIDTGRGPLTINGVRLVPVLLAVDPEHLSELVPVCETCGATEDHPAGFPKTWARGRGHVCVRCEIGRAA